MIDARYSNPIRIYEQDLTLVGEIDEYSSAFLTRSWYGTGQFSIQTNYNTVHATDLQKGRIVMFAKDAYRCGIITSIEKALDENGKGSQVVTAKGYEITFIFGNRIIIPGTGNEYYEITNSAETCMKSLITAQCGSGAAASRQFSGLTIATDQDRGDTYVLKCRYNTTVLAELEKISKATDVGYYIYLDELNQDFVFEIGLGVDRIATQSTNPRAIFSEDYDTIQSAKLSSSDNQYRNYAYVAGQGAGTNRTVREVYSTATSPTGFDRKEIFVDARDLSSNSDLDARGGQKLGELNIQTTIDGMPLVYSPLVYRTDYDLGDICTIDIYGESYDARITEVKESWAPLSYTLDVTFDKAPATISTQVSSAVESTRSTLSQTENSESGYVSGRGWWKKDPDGTLTQRYSLNVDRTTLVNNNIGTYGWSMYTMATPGTWTFPIEFYDADVQPAGSSRTSGYIPFGLPTASSVTYDSIGPASASGIRINLVAHGRWKA